MFPIAHLTGGLLTAYLVKKKRRTILCFLVAGFIGILPDFDFIFNLLEKWTFLSIPDFLMHRNLTHSIVLFGIIVGLLSLWWFKSFWMGFVSIILHCVLDLLDGASLPLFFPGWNINLGKYALDSIFPNFHFHQIGTTFVGVNEITVSGFLGCLFLFAAIGIELYKYYKVPISE